MFNDQKQTLVIIMFYIKFKEQKDKYIGMYLPMRFQKPNAS